MHYCRLTEGLCSQLSSSGWQGGGGIDPTGTGVFAWAYSSIGVDDPSDPQSTFQEHTDCKCLNPAIDQDIPDRDLLFSWLLRHQLPRCPEFKLPELPARQPRHSSHFHDYHRYHHDHKYWTYCLCAYFTTSLHSCALLKRNVSRLRHMTTLSSALAREVSLLRTVCLRQARRSCCLSAEAPQQPRLAAHTMLLGLNLLT